MGSWLTTLVLLGSLVQADGAPLRGITVSTHGIGEDWASDAIGPTLDELAELGANWVAFHPYARIHDDGRVSSSLDLTHYSEHVRRPIRDAHARGLKILIKPHLAYWGGRFSWRGDITFETDEEWDRFFSTYRTWIVDLAAMAAEADAYVVGTELDQTTHHEAKWRDIVAGVRGATEAPLTYAANWTDFERVTFWDALDWVGIQAYFPVTESLPPTRVDLESGWQDLTARLATYGRAQTRPVVLTELGYNRSFRAALEPWKYRVDGPEAEALQAMCLEVALDAVEREPAILGAFLWKWFPIPHQVGRNFQLATPELRAVIRGAWETGEGRR